MASTIIKTNRGNLMIDIPSSFYLVIQNNDGYAQASIEIENEEQAKILVEKINQYFGL